MAVRLQMKLGLVPEADRLPDSPDQMVVVEPSVGSVARTKGSLYLLVTARGHGQQVRRGRRASPPRRSGPSTTTTSRPASASASARPIQLANKKLAHQRDRLGMNGGDADGPIGIGIAVVRGNELYVATVGPAEAYLIRQARLSTLPDPHRERGLPTAELEPEIWRGEISVGDSLVLVSANVVARIGPDELKDAMVTLHPQIGDGAPASPVRRERRHGQRRRGRVRGDRGCRRRRSSGTLVPVRPPEPMAGAPDRSPIPLADEVTGGVAAVQAVRRPGAKSAAGGTLRPDRRRASRTSCPGAATPHRRVNPVSSRRESQRRAAVAVLAFVAVVAVARARRVLLRRPRRAIRSTSTP